MSKTKLQLVKDKIGNSSLGSLNSQEIFTYFTYRAESLLSKRCVLSETELRYLLCETGPGNLRFDPEIVDLLISENSFPAQKISIKKFDEELFLLYSPFPYDELISLAAAKHELIQMISTDANAIVDDLSALIGSIAESSGYKIERIPVENDKLEIVLKDNPFLIWFYPNAWIYPHSAELWQLFNKALEVDLYPIILSRKIHGACFTLFKSAKIFGSNTYSLYLTKRLADKINDLGQSNLPIISDFTPGNISVLPSDMNISNFFYKVLPKYQLSERLDFSHELITILASSKSSSLERLNALSGVALTLPDRHIKKHISNWALERMRLLKEIYNG